MLIIIETCTFVCKALSPPVSCVRNPGTLWDSNTYRGESWGWEWLIQGHRPAWLLTRLTSPTSLLLEPPLRVPERKQPHSRVRWITWAARSRLGPGTLAIRGVRLRQPRARVSARRAMSWARLGWAQHATITFSQAVWCYWMTLTGPRSVAP